MLQDKFLTISMTAKFFPKNWPILNCTPSSCCRLQTLLFRTKQIFNYWILYTKLVVAAVALFQHTYTQHWLCCAAATLSWWWWNEKGRYGCRLLVVCMSCLKTATLARHAAVNRLEIGGLTFDDSRGFFSVLQFLTLLVLSQNKQADHANNEFKSLISPPMGL